MKTLIKKTGLLLSITLLSFFGANSQEIPFIELPQMNLEMRPTVKKASAFQDFNTYIITSENFRLRKEIRIAKQQQDSIYYKSASSTVYVSKADYLKKIRKAANRSETASEFNDRMVNYFPNNDSDSFNFQSVYVVVRDNTFNGYIAILQDEF